MMNKEVPSYLKWLFAAVLIGFATFIILTGLSEPGIAVVDPQDVFIKSVIVLFELAALLIVWRSEITTKTFMMLFAGFTFLFSSSLSNLIEELFNDGLIVMEWIEDIGEPIGLLFLASGLYLWLDERNHLTRIRYNLAKQAGRVGTWEWQLKDDRVRLGETIYNMLGYDPKDLDTKRKSLKELIHPEDRPVFKAQIDTHFNHQTDAFELSLKLKLKSGNYGLFMVRGKAQCDEHKKPYRVFGALTDITRRIEIENKLRQSERNYRLLAENATDVIATFDKELNIQYVSPSVYKLFGYTAEEVSRMDLNTLVTPDSYSDVILAYNQLVRDQLKHGRPMEETRLYLYFIAKSGAKIKVEFVISPMWSEHGRHIGYMTTSRKIRTESFNSTSQMAEPDEKFSTVFNLSPNPMCLVNLSTGAFADANEALLKALSFSKPEVIGKTSDELGSWYNQKEKQAFLKQILSQKFVRNFKSTYTTKKGRVKLCLLSASRMMYHNAPHILVVAEGITSNPRESYTPLGLRQKSS